MKEEKKKLTKEEKKAAKEAKKLLKQQKEPAKTDDSKLDAIIAGQAETNKALNTVASALVKLTEIERIGVPAVQSVEKKKEVYNASIEDETYPVNKVPIAFVRAVHEILSPDFDCRIVNFEDRTDFWFEVIVPDKYSSLSKDEREKGVKDERGKMIPAALGINGVREWCQLIRKNLAKFYSQTGTQSPFQAVE